MCVNGETREVCAGISVPPSSWRDSGRCCVLHVCSKMESGFFVSSVSPSKVLSACRGFSGERILCVVAI